MTTQNETQSTPEFPINPLLTKKFFPICNWHEWLERWENAKTYEELMGLLHVGYSVSLDRYQGDERKYYWTDRHHFYFSVADGWVSSYYLLQTSTDDSREFQIGYLKNGGSECLPIHKLRGKLALKAFDLLCVNFFDPDMRPKSDGDREFMWRWQMVVADDRLFPTLMSFFRPEKDGNVRNMRREFIKPPHGKNTHFFLKTLTTFLWSWREVEISDHTSNKEEVASANIKMRTRVESAKVWMVEVLAFIGELGCLESVVTELSAECLAKLKEIALRTELREYQVVSDSRKVTTLDEACYAGSQVAWFLKRYELKKTVRERLLAIRAAENRKKEAQKELQELQELRG